MELDQPVRDRGCTRPDWQALGELNTLVPICHLRQRGPVSASFIRSSEDSLEVLGSRGFDRVRVCGG